MSDTRGICFSSHCHGEAASPFPPARKLSFDNYICDIQLRSILDGCSGVVCSHFSSCTFSQIFVCFTFCHQKNSEIITMVNRLYTLTQLHDISKNEDNSLHICFTEPFYFHILLLVTNYPFVCITLPYYFTTSYRYSESIVSWDWLSEYISLTTVCTYIYLFVCMPCLLFKFVSFLYKVHK